MNVLVTGAFQLNSGEREQLEAAGHKVFVHGDERAPVDSPERYEAVVCNGLFLYNSIERLQGQSGRQPAGVCLSLAWAK